MVGVDGVSPSHLPWFAEAAWAFTASIYAGGESVACGLVLSGSSSALGGAEASLGPTVAEVLVQMNLQHNMTLQKLVKDRAASLRQLATNPPLSQHRKAKFKTLLNVIPSVPTSLPAEKDDSIDSKATVVSAVDSKIVLTSSTTCTKSSGLAPDAVAVSSDFVNGAAVAQRRHSRGKERLFR